MSNQRTKQKLVYSDETILYHAFVDKNISNVQQLAAVLASLVNGYCIHREVLYVKLLQQAGYNAAQIAAATGRTRERLSQILKNNKQRKDANV